jgi:hypothetical protein
MGIAAGIFDLPGIREFHAASDSGVGLSEKRRSCSKTVATFPGGTVQL